MTSNTGFFSEYTSQYATTSATKKKATKQVGDFEEYWNSRAPWPPSLTSNKKVIENIFNAGRAGGSPTTVAAYNKTIQDLRESLQQNKSWLNDYKKAHTAATQENIKLRDKLLALSEERDEEFASMEQKYLQQIEDLNDKIELLEID